MKKKNLTYSKQNEISIDPIHRRMFIKSALGYMALPLLSSLIPKEVLAQMAGVAPRRFIGITSRDQFPMQYLFPKGFVGKNNSAAYKTVTTAFQEGTSNFSETDLMAFASANGSVSGALGPSFNSFLNRIAMIGGFDFPGRVDHGFTSNMGNIAGSVLGTDLSLNGCYTLDRVLVRNAAIYATATDANPGLGLRLGELSNSIEATGASARGLEAPAGMARNYNGNLNQIFSNYFKASGSSSTPSPTPTLATDQSRKKMVDLVYQNASSVRNGTKVSSEDKLRIDDYLQSLSDIQKTLTPSTTTSSSSGLICPATANDFTSLVASPDFANGINGYTNTATYYKDLVRVITLFIKCDICRVFNVGITSGIVSNTEFGGHQLTDNRPWHLDWGHNNKYDKLLPVQKWILENVVLEIMKNLDIAEGNEKFIDNTLIYYTPEMSFGHCGINMGAILAGDKRLAGGKAYNYADYNIQVDDVSWYGGSQKMEIAPGQPINRLWITIMQAMGIPTYNYFGKYGCQNNTYGIWVDSYDDSKYENYYGKVSRSKNISLALPRVLKV